MGPMEARAAAAGSSFDLGPPKAPTSLVASWDLGRAAPALRSVEYLLIASLRTREPARVAGFTGASTVAEVKRAFAQQLHLSARKAVVLRFFGETMENDEATLDQLKVSNGTRLDAAFRQRTPSELEALKAINYVLVVDTSGECAVMDGLSAATPVAALKERLKTPQCLLYFSTTFSPTFGTPLADERTLGSYGVLDGDVLYYTTGAPPKEEEKPKEAKKK